MPHGRDGDAATLVRLADQRADFEVAVEQMRLKMEREQERLGPSGGIHLVTWWIIPRIVSR